MPRQRIIAIVWLIGVVTLIGAWGHSLFSNSALVCRSAGLHRHLEVGLGAGSVLLHARGEHPMIAPGWYLHSRRWQETRPAPDPFATTPPPPPVYLPPPYWCGRFKARQQGHVEVPIWFLLVFFSGTCLPFYLRFSEQGLTKSSDGAPLPDLPDDHDPDKLNFKLY